MPVTVVRFNLVDPAATPASLSERYQAALEMAAYADDRGISTVQTEEHHGAENNWLPSPFAFAGAVFGATRRIAVTVSAIIGPLHDPLRLAEDIAVLDLLSGGRLVTVAGIGYRPEEYEQSGVEWKRRGKLQDELLETLLAAWTGEPFTFRGRTVRITPRPFTQPHPMLLVGGSSKAAARRAARFGLPFFPSAHLPDLEAYYNEQLAEHGTEGWTMMPAAETPLLHIADDPDRAWAEHGKHFLHEARTYASWQNKDIRSAVKSAATTVEELRAEGVYRILTPEECVTYAKGDTGSLVLHPLSGGMPVDEGWRSLHHFCENVLPRLKDK
ncbi:LLM class flavin-dependent oxidoreductase [Streptomyces kanamyceticus]|uniref:LLM class flavin-dependent oxidoreductase n=1 Tax=Streptomyces kanamyceticus TaxID=1967 RepID=A0A5J6GCJ7_STRKN|nr:LLM class flavin-dependent oxidoreductase [Streptomyces kanamyceticus]QEU91551.1 LLM class flavin-dependent oxidoreductase [Streptomyces kanamyceticus]